MQIRPRHLLIKALFTTGLLSTPGLMFSQAIYGSVYGTVTDPSGAAVPGATVLVTDVQKGTSQTATTNATGNWTVEHLVPDDYIVKVDASSFSSSTSSPLQIHADVAQKVDLALTVAGSTQNVTVTSEAPALKTDRADVSEVLDERAIANLPNFTRNFTSFLLLTPGIQHSSFNIAGPENPQGGLNLNSNGSNYGEQGFLLDGTDNRDPVLGIIVINPTLDSISETKVTTQNYDAELGGAAGGIVSVLTKSGGNALHGDVFFFRHSDRFYARNPFNQFAPDSITHRTIPSEVYGQFGGSVSGPIKKDHSFFFLDYQGLRNRLGTSLTQNVPTALVRDTCLTATTGNCDLSEYIKPNGTSNGILYNPVTKQPYSTTPGQIPVSALSAPAVALLKLLPASNSPGQGINNNYVASGSGSLNSDQADIRLDEQLKERLHLFGRYDIAFFRLFGQPVFGTAGGNGFGQFGSTGNTKVQNQSATVGLDFAVKPTLLTDLRVGFLSYHVAESKFPGEITATQLGIPNLNTAPDTGGSSSFSFNNGAVSNLGNQNCNCPLIQSEQVFQLNNNWTKVRGNHAFRFGADLRYAKNVRDASDNNRAGQFTFDNSTTGNAGATGAASTGSDLASYLVGYAAHFQRFNVYINDQYNYQKRGAFYAQDTWRVTPKLTLNYGVRWDVIFPETVNGLGHGGFASFEAGGIRVAGAAGIGTNGNQRMDYTNVAPRFGLAYQVTPTTVFRIGGGQTYDTVGYFGTLFGSALSHNLPVQANEDINRIGNIAPNSFAATLAAPPVRPAQPTIPTNGIIPFQDQFGQSLRPERIQLPKVDQFNAAVQQQFGNSTTFELAYVGNIGERVYPGETFGYDQNQPTLPVTPADIAKGNTSRRPYLNKFVGTYNGAPTLCCSNGIGSSRPDGRATYNALQTKLDKRFSNGLQFNANYSWSKAENFANDPAYIYYRKQYSWGRNDTNRSHIFVFSSVYSLPFGKGKMFLGNANRLMDYLVGGYTLAGQTTWESGRPFTPTYQECGADQDLDTNFAGPGTTSDCRPNGNPGAFHVDAGRLDPISHARSFFIPVAPLTANGAFSGPFSRPAFGTFGHTRNSLIGPRDYFADLSVIKDLSVTERIKGQFQVQAFNVFNHAALDIPNSSNGRCIDCSVATGTPGSGAITNLESNSTMRRLQFAARITF